MVSYVTSAVNFVNPFASRDSAVKKKTRDEVLVEVGSSNVVIDGIRNFLSFPQKLMFLNSSINSGNVSPEVIDKMKDYLHENGLHEVAVSVNQYKPQQVWQRVFSNPRTSLLSKLTVGIATGLLETLAAPKLTGLGDHYNAASNTVHLFSNDLSIALHECGHAKDFNSRENPILYSATSILPSIGPFFTLFHEYCATANAIKYLRDKDPGLSVRNAFKVLIPAYAAYCANALYPLSTEMVIELYNFDAQKQLTIAVLLTSVAVGHIAARILAAKEPVLAAKKPEKPSEAEKK